VDEAQAPALIGLCGSGGTLRTTGQALFAAPSHLQPFGAIEPVDSLVVVGEALAAKQDEQTADAPAPAHGGVAAQGLP